MTPKIDLSERITAKTAMELLNVDLEGLKGIIHRFPKLVIFNTNGEFFWTRKYTVGSVTSPEEDNRVDVLLSKVQRELGFTDFGTDIDLHAIHKQAALRLSHDLVHQMVFLRRQIEQVIAKTEERPENDREKTLRLVRTAKDNGLAARMGGYKPLQLELETIGIDGEKIPAYSIEYFKKLTTPVLKGLYSRGPKRSL